MRTTVILIVVTIFALSLFSDVSFSAGSDIWNTCGAFTDCPNTGTKNYAVGCFYDGSGVDAYCCSVASAYGWKTGTSSPSQGCGCLYAPGSHTLNAGENAATSATGSPRTPGYPGQYTFFETPHKYSKYMDCLASGVYTCPSGSSIRFYLTARTESVSSDYLSIQNSGGTEYARLGGAYDPESDGADDYDWTPIYSQNTAKFQFHSDVNNQDWGVDVLKIECIAATPTPTSTPIPACTLDITSASVTTPTVLQGGNAHTWITVLKSGSNCYGKIECDYKKPPPAVPTGASLSPRPNSGCMEFTSSPTTKTLVAAVSDSGEWTVASCSVYYSKSGSDCATLELMEEVSPPVHAGHIGWATNPDIDSHHFTVATPTPTAIPTPIPTPCTGCTPPPTSTPITPTATPITPTATATPIPFTCTETDDGEKYEARGTARLMYGATPLASSTDYCKDDAGKKVAYGTWLVEFYCRSDGGAILSSLKSCTCSDGACIPSTPTATPITPTATPITPTPCTGCTPPPTSTPITPTPTKTPTPTITPTPLPCVPDAPCATPGATCCSGGKLYKCL